MFGSLADKKLYVVAGCNGAGKTTASFTILPEIIECKEFVNLFDIYLPLVDGTFIFDNSMGRHELLAQKTVDRQFAIINHPTFNELKNNMTTVEKQLELRDKILLGLEKTYEKLIEFKKQKNSGFGHERQQDRKDQARRNPRSEKTTMSKMLEGP
ncbi:MAG TPA: hypothetical protein VKZ51_02915 [Cyclobacteriaceae bacterium]|nr:hypothetical protein [Cyclobacteriaceae bacterium]